jgi:hypothetical protein
MERSKTDLAVALQLLFPGSNYRVRAARWLGMSELNLWGIMVGRHRLAVRHKNRLLARVDVMRGINRNLVIERVIARLDAEDAEYERAGRLIGAIDPLVRASSRLPKQRVGRPRSRVARLTREAVTSAE